MIPKNQKKEDSSILFNEESKQLQGETQSGNISSKPTKLLAWSSYMSNKISIIELETKQEFAYFDGVKLNETDGYSSHHVKEIENTEFLVSIRHDSVKSANLEVFDVSRKGQPKKIYSAAEVSGITGFGDVTYNPRRGFLGAMCVGKEIAYHLYNFGTSKSDGIVKLIRKSRWHSQYGTKERNFITSLDFNPNGETVATFDNYGMCLISDVNTNSYRFHLNMEMKTYAKDAFGRCRWSTYIDEPLLFIKYDRKHLNILDVEKKALILKGPIQIESAEEIFWIDVCPSDGNILAAGGNDGNVKLFDKRESKVVRTIGGIHKHTAWINCVRWSPSGDMIASASGDRTVALLDFKTGKKLYNGYMSEGSKFILFD